MNTLFKEHGHRRLIMIFMLIMFSVLVVFVKSNTINISGLTHQFAEMKEKQSGIESTMSTKFTVLKTETTKTIKKLEKKLDEQDKLISELERLLNR